MGNGKDRSDLTALDLRADQIPADLRHLPLQFSRLPLPSVQQGIAWGDLKLPIRVHRRLAGKVTAPQDLPTLTLGDLTKINGFGKKCLWQLLEALRHQVRPSPVSAGTPQTDQPAADQTAETKPTRTGGPAVIFDITADQIPANPLDLPREIGDLHLPSVPDGVRWEGLRLSVRIRKRLSAKVRTPQELGQITLRDLAISRGFGKESLCGLLDAMKAVRELAAPCPHADAVPAIESAGTPPSSERGFRGVSDTWEAVRAAKQLVGSRYAKLIRADDPRFGLAVRSISPHARTAADAAQALLNSVAKSEDAGRESTVRWLAGALAKAVSLPLDLELAEFLSTQGERPRRIVSRYLGWDGAGTSTLQEVGTLFHLTRERVRQICSPVLADLEGKKPFTPALDRVLSYIEKFAPAPSGEVETRLRTSGHVTVLFKLSGIVKAAEVFSRRVPFRLSRRGDVWFVGFLSQKCN